MIDTKTILTGFLLFCCTFVLLPLALVLREKVLWWWMHKYLINENFWDDVNQYVRDNCYHRHHFNHQTQIHWEKGKCTEYRIIKDDEPIVVTEKQLAYYSKKRDESASRLEKIEPPVDKTVGTYKMLLKYFKHDEVGALEKSINRLIDKEDAKLAKTVPMLQQFVDDTSKTYSDEHIDKILQHDKRAEEILEASNGNS